jgi:hypothetical protein
MLPTGFCEHVMGKNDWINLLLEFITTKQLRESESLVAALARLHAQAYDSAVLRPREETQAHH